MVVDRVSRVSAVLIFVLGGTVADVMVDDNVVDEVTTDAAVDDVVFVDFVADEMVFVSGSGSASCSHSRSYSGFRFPAFADAHFL